MSELKVKGTVRPRSLFIAAAVINAANELDLVVNMLVTSGDEKETKHMKGSAHYVGNALDFRVKHLKEAEKKLLVTIAKRRLGKDYEVEIHDKGTKNEHLHSEYDPV